MEIRLNDIRLSDHDDADRTDTSSTENSSEIAPPQIKYEREFLAKLLQQQTSPVLSEATADHRKDQTDFFKKLKGDGESPAPPVKKRTVHKPNNEGMMKKKKPVINTVKGRQPGPPVSTYPGTCIIIMYL